ncbi:hypothetical protein D9M68_746820 [compost metagenome]
MPTAHASIRFCPPSGNRLPPIKARSAAAKYIAISPIESPSRISASTDAVSASRSSALRRATENPARAAIAATSSKRCGWRGISSNAGRRTSPASACQREKASSSSGSSPSRVLAAASTWRPLKVLRSRSPSAMPAGAGCMSNLRLPVICTAGTPSARKRSASPAVCASTPAKSRYMADAARPKRAVRRKLRGDRRALTRYNGTPALRAPRTTLGHTSVSISIPASGRKYRKKRRTSHGRSYGR